MALRISEWARQQHGYEVQVDLKLLEHSHRLGTQRWIKEQRETV
jgi:hypothetical protein